jgi:hypothetical protein
MLSVTVELKLIGCPKCGCAYGVPFHLDRHLCPSCAARTVQETRYEVDAANEELCGRDRTIAALKGALTKAKERP